MLRTDTFLEVHETKYFKSDIQLMDIPQLKTLCSFLEERELEWVRNIVDEDKKYVIENILYKI